MTEKACSNCYFNDGYDCREPGPPEEKNWIGGINYLEDALPCPGWRPIFRPDSDDDGEPD